MHPGINDRALSSATSLHAAGQEPIPPWSLAFGPISVSNLVLITMIEDPVAYAATAFRGLEHMQFSRLRLAPKYIDWGGNPIVN